MVFPRQYPALVRDTAWLHRMTRVATRYLKHFSFLWRLHKDVAAFHVTQGASVSLPKPRRAVTPAPWWGMEEDRDCLLGTVRHGWGNWRGICEDASLCFQAKGVVYTARGEEEEEMEEMAEEGKGVETAVDALKEVEDGVGGDVKSGDVGDPMNGHNNDHKDDAMNDHSNDHANSHNNDHANSHSNDHIDDNNDNHVNDHINDHINDNNDHRNDHNNDHSNSHNNDHTNDHNDTHINDHNDTHPKNTHDTHDTKVFPSTQLLMKRVRRLVDAMEAALEKGLQSASLDYVAARPATPKKPKKSSAPFRGGWQVKEAKALRNAILRWGLPLPPLTPSERFRASSSDRAVFPEHSLAREREMAAICDVVDALVRDVQAQSGVSSPPVTLLPPSTHSARDTASPFRFHACPACTRGKTGDYCPFCDLYVALRVLKVESGLLYKSYLDVQDLSRFLELKTNQICDVPSRGRGKKPSEEDSPAESPKIPSDVEAILPSTVLAQRLHSRLQLYYDLQQLVWPREEALLRVLLQRWAAGASHHQETVSKGWRAEVHDVALLAGVYRWGVVEWDILWRDPLLPFFIDNDDAKRRPLRRRRKGGKKEEAQETPDLHDETLEEETPRVEKPPYTLEDAMRLKSPRVDRSQLVGIPAGVEGRWRDCRLCTC